MTFNSRMSMMKKIIFTALLGCFFSNCDSSNEEVSYQYPSNLVFTQSEILDNVKVYTKNGQINDPSVVEKFISDAVEKNIFKDKIGNEKNLNNEVEIIFESKESISIRQFGQWTKFSVSYQKDKNFIAPKDTVKFILPEQSNLEVLKLEANIGLFKGYLVTTRLPWVPGDQQFFYEVKTFNKTLFWGNPNKIIFNGMSYKIKLNTGLVAFHNFLSNEGFDKNAISLLNIGDTIAVQNKKQVYERVD